MSEADPSEIDGVWEMVRAEFDGTSAPDLVVANTTVELACGEYRVRFRGETADAGNFELGRSLDAKTMLLRGMEGLNSGRLIPCIYQLSGNRLRICYGLDGGVPTEFKTSGEKARYLAAYRRKSEHP